MKAITIVVCTMIGIAIATMSSSVQAATITVSSTADSGAGTLRQALASAGNGDTIDATGVTGTITLTTAYLYVGNSVTILGPGPASLAINGNAANRVFYISGHSVVTMAGLTITNGHATTGGVLGGGIYNLYSTLTLSNCTLSGNKADGEGGGLYNDGHTSGGATVTVVNCTFNGNSSSTTGGGIFNNGSSGGSAMLTVISSTFSGNSATNYAGGIYNGGQTSGSATLTVSNSTFNGNLARSYHGGGLYNDGASSGNAALTMANCTLSGNSAGRYGGGIFTDGESQGSARLTMANSTLSSNSAPSGGGGIYNVGLLGTGTVTIAGTILNASTIARNGGTVSSLGYNLSSDTGGGFLTATGDLTNTNAMLGPLQNNGGPTPTHALLPASPAIDAGDPGLTSGYDQRGGGYPRVLANYTGVARADIGAFEAGMTYTFGDGIPDSWRAHYFGGDGSTTNNQSCATCDFTGTGQNNLFKYIAGLYPMNPASVFVLSIANVAGQPTQKALTWTPLATGRTYTPEYRTNMVSGVFTNLTTYTGPTTNSTQVAVTDTNATQVGKFYHIRISYP